MSQPIQNNSINPNPSFQNDRIQKRLNQIKKIKNRLNEMNNNPNNNINTHHHQISSSLSKKASLIDEFFINQNTNYNNSININQNNVNIHMDYNINTNEINTKPDETEYKSDSVELNVSNLDCSYDNMTGNEKGVKVFYGGSDGKGKDELNKEDDKKKVNNKDNKEHKEENGINNQSDNANPFFCGSFIHLSNQLIAKAAINNKKNTMSYILALNNDFNTYNSYIYDVEDTIKEEIEEPLKLLPKSGSVVNKKSSIFKSKNSCINLCYKKSYEKIKKKLQDEIKKNISKSQKLIKKNSNSFSKYNNYKTYNKNKVILCGKNNTVLRVNKKKYIFTPSSPSQKKKNEQNGNNNQCGNSIKLNKSYNVVSRQIFDDNLNENKNKDNLDDNMKGTKQVLYVNRNKTPHPSNRKLKIEVQNKLIFNSNSSIYNLNKGLNKYSSLKDYNSNLQKLNGENKCNNCKCFNENNIIEISDCKNDKINVHSSSNSNLDNYKGNFINNEIKYPINTKNNTKNNSNSNVIKIHIIYKKKNDNNIHLINTNNNNNKNLIENINLINKINTNTNNSNNDVNNYNTSSTYNIENPSSSIKPIKPNPMNLTLINKTSKNQKNTPRSSTKISTKSLKNQYPMTSTASIISKNTKKYNLSSNNSKSKKNKKVISPLFTRTTRQKKNKIFISKNKYDTNNNNQCSNFLKTSIDNLNNNKCSCSLESNKINISLAMQKLKFSPLSSYINALNVLNKSNKKLFCILICIDSKNGQFIFRGLYQIKENDICNFYRIYSNTFCPNKIGIKEIKYFYVLNGNFGNGKGNCGGVFVRKRNDGGFDKENLLMM